MADSGIKKIRIKKDSLPPMDAIENGYVFRYRVVSEDKNRYSHWSPILTLVPGYTFDTGIINHVVSGNINTIVWDSVSIIKNTKIIATENTYDVWIRWDRGDNGDWIYKGRLNSTTASLITPTDYKINNSLQGVVPNKLSVEIFLKGYPITRDITSLRVYQGGPWTV
jgi:hypothetical protein